MAKEIERKHYLVRYHHEDGRKGEVVVTTVISKSGAFDYGNGKTGMLVVSNDYSNARYYDLRYNRETNLHPVMIKDYFGKGLKEFKEV